MNKITLCNFVQSMKPEQHTLIIIRRHDCLVFHKDDEIPYDLAHESIVVITENTSHAIVELVPDYI